MDPLPTEDSNGNPVPYLSPQQVIAQLAPKIQARQNATSDLGPRIPSGSSLLPLDDEDYAKILKEATPADLESLNLSDAELDFLHAKAKGREHGSGLAKSRWEQAYKRKAALELGAQQGSVPTPQGQVNVGGPTMLGSPGIGQPMRSDPPTPQELAGLGGGPEPISQILGRIAAQPMKVAATDTSNPNGWTVSVPKEEGALKTMGRKVAGVGATVAGLGEGLVDLPLSLAQSVMNRGTPEQTSASQQQAQGIAEGLTKPYKNLSDVVMSPIEGAGLGNSGAWESTKRNWLGNPITTGIETALGIVGAKHIARGAAFDASAGAPSPIEAPALGDFTNADVPIERRIGIERDKITAQATDILKNRKLPEAMDEIQRLKQVGDINGPQESALLREVQSQHTKQRIGDIKPEEPSGAGKSQAEMAELNKAQAEMDRKASLPQPDPPSASAGFPTADDHEVAGGGVLENIAAAYADNQTKNFAQSNDFALRALDGLKNIADSGAVRTMFGTLPQFFKDAWSKHQDVFAAFVRKLGASEDVKVAVTEHIKEGLNKILTNPKDQALFMKAIIANNALGMAEDAAVRGVKLTSIEQARVASPQFQLAMNFFDEFIKPELATWKEPAGIKSTRTTPDDRYMKFMPVRPGTEPPKGTYVVDAEGNLSQWSQQLAERFRANSGFGGSRKTRKVRAGAARPATGAGQYWIADPTMVYGNALMDRLPKARHNQMIDVVKGYEVSKEEAKAGVTKDGEQVVSIPVNPYMETVDATPVAKEHIAVPKSIADIYNYSNSPWMPKEWVGLSALNRAQVTLMLMSPAEAIVHSINVLSALYRQAGVGGNKGPIGSLIAKDPTGVGRWIMTMAEVADQSGEKLATNIRRLSTNGALRAKQFGEAGKGPFKRAVFDYPNLSKRGLGGLEARSRSAMLNILDKYEPDWTDAQKAAVINNEFGTYVATLQPDLVKAMKVAPIINDPFAATINLTKGSFKALGGQSGRYGFGPSAEVAWATWGPALTLPILLNKMLDPQHRWAWQIKGLKAGDVRIYRDDKTTVDIPFRLLAPVAARGMGVLGLQNTLNDVAKGKLTPGKFLENTVLGAVNTAMTRVGPMGRTLLTAGTGFTTHINPDFTPMQVADKSTTNQIKANAIAAGKQLGFARDTIGSIAPESRTRNLTPVMRRVYQTLSFFGQTLKVGPNEQVLGTLEDRPPMGRIRDVQKDIMKHARDIKNPKARQKYIKRRIAQDLPKPVAR